MPVTPFSFIDYVASASQTNFAIVRPRISDTHLRVFQEGVLLVLTTDYTIVAGDIVLVVGATSGDKVRIERRTPQVARVVDYAAGGNLTEQDLDNSALQNMYLAQEALDNMLQLQDQPTVVVDWTPLTLVVLDPDSTFDESATSRLTPALGTEPKSQQWIRVDVANKEVDLAPGSYRIDVVATAGEQTGGTSKLSMVVGDDNDGAGSTILHQLAKTQPVDISAWVSGTYVFNLTAETALTFKAAVVVAGGDIDLVAPVQWTVTRLGGDPALN